MENSEIKNIEELLKEIKAENDSLTAKSLGSSALAIGSMILLPGVGILGGLLGMGVTTSLFYNKSHNDEILRGLKKILLEIEKGTEIKVDDNFMSKVREFMDKSSSSELRRKLAELLKTIDKQTPQKEW